MTWAEAIAYAIKRYDATQVRWFVEGYQVGYHDGGRWNFHWCYRVILPSERGTWPRRLKR